MLKSTVAKRKIMTRPTEIIIDIALTEKRFEKSPSKKDMIIPARIA